MKCSFCGKNFDKGTGIMYVKKTGKIFYFCSSKCEKIQIIRGKKPRTTLWTQEFIKAKGDKK
ncbi:MAG: 50S ribosomal protein L24e [bacterium]|nr:50S ribosomal protein L24e [bacterium]